MGCCQSKQTEAEIEEELQKPLALNEIDEKELKDITKIQAHIRGNQARKKVKNLSKEKKNNKEEKDYQSYKEEQEKISSNDEEENKENSDQINNETAKKIETLLGYVEIIPNTETIQYEGLPSKYSKIMDDNSLYTGQWLDGKMHGRGKLEMINGSIYEGY